MLAGAERVERTIALAEVFHLTGDVARAETAVREARDIADELDDRRLLARCDHSLAESARRVGRFDDAVRLLQQAFDGFSEVHDDAGAADVLQVTGTVAAQRGDPSTARQRYLECMGIRERLHDTAGVAAITNNLGIVAQQQGEALAARAFAERAMDLYTELGDRRRIGICHINLAWMRSLAGDHDAARQHCEIAIRLASEVGDRLNVAIAQNNLGDALREVGRFAEAGAAYAIAVEAYRDLDDLGPLMALLEDVAILAMLRRGHDAAMALVGASDALRAALGSPRSAAGEAALVERLGPARDALGEAAAAAARARGADLSMETAIELAIDEARGETAA